MNDTNTNAKATQEKAESWLRSYRFNEGLMIRTDLEKLPAEVRPFVSTFRKGYDFDKNASHCNRWMRGHNQLACAIDDARRGFLPGTKGNCPKCDGKGFIEAFNRVKGGTCFMCHGTKNLKVRRKK